MNRTTAFFGALAATLTVVGCAAPVGGAAAPEAKGADVMVEETAATTTTMTEAPMVYQDVSGLGRVTFTDPSLPYDPFQWGTEPMPGIALAGNRNGCTIGPAVAAIDGTREGFLTAGHCDESLGPDIMMFTNSSATDVMHLGAVTAAVDTVTGGVYFDAGIIWDGMHDENSVLMAGAWPVTRVMPVAEIQQLPVGTPICINGGKTGVDCTPLLGANDLQITYKHASEGGDSGAPVFVVDSTDNAILLGVHHGLGATSSIGAGTYLEPTLAKLGVEAVLAII